MRASRNRWKRSSEKGDNHLLCTESHFQLPSAIVSHGAQGATVIWTDHRFGKSDVFGQRVSRSGVTQWTVDGLPITTAANDQTFTVAQAAGTGAVVFWDDDRSTSTDIYGQRISNLGQLPLWTFNGLPLGTTTQDESQPLAISDGSNGSIVPIGWLVCWLRKPGLTDEIRVQHVNGDGEGLWTPAGTGGVSLVSSNGGIGSYAMAPDGGGRDIVLPLGAVVAWSEVRGASGSDIYARRISNQGEPQWTANGNLVCGLSGSQTAPAIAHVGSGNVILAWEDLRTPDRNVWAQKLNSSGAAQWTANGVPVCQSSGEQIKIEMIPDGAGGVIMMWEDSRSGEVREVYAQRLDANGQRLWLPADGIPLCSAVGSEIHAAMISDGAGGAIVAWTDGRNETYDIYAQRVDANGNLVWPSGGVAVTLAAGTQDYVQLASDGANGAIAAWADGRSISSDVYANRILAGGVLETPTFQPNTLRLALASSNPARGEVRMLLDLPEAAVVTAEVWDVAGRRLRTLVAGAELGIGAHSITWDGTYAAGDAAAAGVYYVRVRAGAAVRVMRIVRLS